MNTNYLIRHPQALVVLLTLVLACRGSDTPVAADTSTEWHASTGSGPINVNCFAMSNSRLYAGSNAGIFLSTNNGVSWSLLGLSNTGTMALLATDSLLVAGTFNGISRSVDAGLNWVDASNGIQAKATYSFALAGPYIVAGTIGAGVFRSSDQGVSWTQVSNGLTNYTVRTLAFVHNALFASTNDGVFRSGDYGMTWTLANDGIGTNVSSNAIASIGNYVFAGTTGDGVYVSINDGGNWTAAGPKGVFIFQFARSGQSLYVASYSGVFVTSDNATTWSSLNAGLPTNYINAIAINGSTIFVGTAGYGVWQRPL
jgi:ligand-binding sensor domain-containing protein